jgi:hypothetical protein
MTANDDDVVGDDGASPTPPPPSSSSSSAATAVKFFELDDAFADDGTNVVGTKFFGGSSVKDELYIPEEEEMALVLQGVIVEEEDQRRGGPTDYHRFEDGNAFGDDFAGRVGAALQSAINRVLYDDDDDDDDDDDAGASALWTEDPSMGWTTPFPRRGGPRGTPLVELAASRAFYNRLDVAIISAITLERTTTTGGGGGGTAAVEVRWDVGAVWPNPWESRVLLTGTSVLTVREEGGGAGGGGACGGFVLLGQRDVLDGGGDIVGALSSQLPPRFWDVYHIGMTPSAELDPRLNSPPTSSSRSLSTSSSSGKEMNERGGGKRGGPFSAYRLSYLPPRLVIEPSLVDSNGRDGRAAQALPNHAFTTAIKTMGPNKDRFVPASPVEVSISKVADDGGGEGGGGSLVRWTVPVPPEFASRIVLPLPAIGGEDVDDDDDGGGGGGGGEASGGSPPLGITTTRKKFTPPYTPGRTSRPPPTPPASLSCGYALRPTRLVATLPYAGNPQDQEVTRLRKRLYDEAVERDGHVPKLDPVTGRPMFFFWMNDAKACFTRDGGLGMAVYEWRAGWSKSNEVGIELVP